MTLTAPEDRAADFSEGGVRPAARWPASVRSRVPSRAVADASARTWGLAFFPLAVRATFCFGARFSRCAMRRVYGVEAGAHRGELAFSTFTLPVIVRRHPAGRRRASGYSGCRAATRSTARARAIARRGEFVLRHVVLSVGHRPGIHALPHGALSRSDRIARTPLVRSRTNRVPLSGLHEELRRLSDVGGGSRPRSERADDVRVVQRKFGGAERDSSRVGQESTDRRHHSPIGLPRRANAFQRQRRRLARHRP